MKNKVDRFLIGSDQSIILSMLQEVRLLIFDLTTNDVNMALANIYAPNEDNPAFFEDFFYRLSDFNCDDIVIGGDFNLVFDLEKDKKGGFGETWVVN